MRSLRSFPVLVVLSATALATIAHAAGSASPAVSRDYVSRLDGPVATALGTDGRLWSAWSYRGSGEFDLAIAVRDADGTWTATRFLGRQDGVDQLEPSIALDAVGNAYVAFATRAPQRIWLATLPSGTAEWSTPEMIAPGENGSAPAIRVVRDRIVVAYRIVRGIRIVDLPLYVSPAQTHGIQDGPDGIDPLGNTGRSDLPSDDRDDQDTPPPPPSESGS